MAQKSFNYIPSVEESRDRRAAKVERRVKITRAKDQDWKQEAGMLGLLGYGKYDVQPRR